VLPGITRVELKRVDRTMLDHEPILRQI